MNFKTVAEAFNFWNTKTVQEIETRATQIKELIQKDASADVAALNIEIEGLKQAKANIEQRNSQQQADPPRLAYITGGIIGNKAE